MSLVKEKEAIETPAIETGRYKVDVLLSALAVPVDFYEAEFAINIGNTNELAPIIPANYTVFLGKLTKEDLASGFNKNSKDLYAIVTHGEGLFIGRIEGVSDKENGEPINFSHWLIHSPNPKCSTKIINSGRVKNIYRVVGALQVF